MGLSDLSVMSGRVLKGGLSIVLIDEAEKK